MTNFQLLIRIHKLKTEKMNRRRNFIKTSIAAGAGLAIAPSLTFASVSATDKARIAFIGVGLRGRNHLTNMLLRDDVVVPAICDIDPESLNEAKKLINGHNHPMPAFYTGNDYSFMDLLARNDIDGVIISTPWLWHTRMAVATLQAGKHAGVEVSAATTMEECWDLVNTHEETGKHCMILENACYDRNVMAVLQMVRAGLFGEMIHARCGYQHDLREVKFNNGKQPYGGGVEFGEKGFSEARWRTEHSLKQNADVYPTHGVGPIATMLNINRGNRFLSLTSTASKARGLHDYIVNHPEGGPNHPNAKLVWKLGDVVTTTIKTANEETILVTHDTNLARPYSLGFRVQGVKGLTEFDSDNRRIYVDGKSEHHQWEEMDKYLKEYDHPLWKRWGEHANGAGHGGIDFFIDNAFVEFIKRGDYPPIDVYDAAAWSAITPLSEASIANNGEPQEFPDFTRGQWITNKPIFALKGDEY
jgi:predicted dehydrogenase